MEKNWKIEDETNIVNLANHAIENIMILIQNNGHSEELERAFSALKRIRDLSQIKIDIKRWR